ncbi:hypothetical protein B0H10DRAFT_2235063 [Mycena sp. CBHHK59/15]|nr:hypothetical protein B0H10DRAFT_2235063 [Mycena sp. CBHHK59/15]
MSSNEHPRRNEYYSQVSMRIHTAQACERAATDDEESQSEHPLQRSANSIAPTLLSPTDERARCHSSSSPAARARRASSPRAGSSAHSTSNARRELQRQRDITRHMPSTIRAPAATAPDAQNTRPRRAADRNTWPRAARTRPRRAAAPRTHGVRARDSLHNTPCAGRRRTKDPPNASNADEPHPRHPCPEATPRARSSSSLAPYNDPRRRRTKVRARSHSLMPRRPRQNALLPLPPPAHTPAPTIDRSIHPLRCSGPQQQRYRDAHEVRPQLRPQLLHDAIAHTRTNSARTAASPLLNGDFTPPRQARGIHPLQA